MRPARDAAEVHERKGHPHPCPHALEVGAGGLRDFHRLLSGLEAALALELELVQTREPHVRDGELRRRARGLEDAPGFLELLVRLVRPALLPVAASADEPVARRFELLARCDETGDAVVEHGLGRAGLAVGPEHASHAAEQPRALDRIVDVGERTLEHLERLGERERRLGVLRGLEADRDGVVEARRAEQVAGDSQRARAVLGENLGRAAVDLLASREDDLVGDRLLGERVSPAVGPRPPATALRAAAARSPTSSAYCTTASSAFDTATSVG